MKKLILVFMLWMTVALQAQSPSKGIFISREEIAKLPMTGAPWIRVKAAADSLGTINLSNLDGTQDVNAYASALVYVRTGQVAYRDRVITRVFESLPTFDDKRTLEFARNIGAVVLAIDLVGLSAEQETTFKNWLRVAITKTIDGKTLISTWADRPNNWGTQAFFALMCVYQYLGDDTGLNDTVKKFKGWLGDRSAYAGFDYGDLSWQCDRANPVGINPKGCTVSGHLMDGGLPEELRRAGSFRWPPPCENYVWTGLEGAVAGMEVVRRARLQDGTQPWKDVANWSDQAIYRAYKWLYTTAQCQAVGNDRWQPHLANYLYADYFAANQIPLFPEPVDAQVGKSIGHTDWTHAERGSVIDPPPPGDKQITFEFHFVNGLWTCHRLSDTEDVTGSGVTEEDALKDWLNKNQL